MGIGIAVLSKGATEIHSEIHLAPEAGSQDRVACSLGPDRGLYFGPPTDHQKYDLFLSNTIGISRDHVWALLGISSTT